MKKNLLLLFTLVTSLVSAQTLDNSYGYHGKTFSFLSSPDIAVTSSFLLANNKLIVSGLQSNEGANRLAFLASFTANGRPDINFGEEGVENIHGLVSAFSAAAPINRIDVASWNVSPDGFFQQLVVSRFGSLGHPDASFGTNGTVNYSAGSIYQYPTCIAVDALGIIYVGGVFNDQSNNIVITRFKPDGSNDTGYKIMGATTRTCKSLLLLKNDFVLAGFYDETTDGKYTASVIKYNARGKIDASFADNGVLKLNNNLNASGNQTIYLQCADNGSFIVLYNNGNDMVFQKFNANGTPDNSFGTNSIASTHGAVSATFAVDDNGNILQPLTSFTIKRYTNSGVVDASFGNNGLLTTDFSVFGFDNTLGTFNQIIPQPDGFYATGAYADDVNYAVVSVKYKTGSTAPVAADNTAVEKSITANAGKIIIAPNPVHDVLDIHNLPVKAHLLIMNAQGTVVKSAESTSGSIKLNVENLSSGTYYVELRETNQKEKFIKF